MPAYIFFKIECTIASNSILIFTTDCTRNTESNTEFISNVQLIWSLHAISCSHILSLPFPIQHLIFFFLSPLPRYLYVRLFGFECVCMLSPLSSLANKTIKCNNLFHFENDLLSQVVNIHDSFHCASCTYFPFLIFMGTVFYVCVCV